MRADRLVSLVLLLRQRGRMTADTLARELEVSTRTVLRDIAAPLYFALAIVKTMYFDEESDVEVSGGGNAVEGTIVAASALWLSVIGYLFIPMLAVASAHAASVLF